jgi:hypothetical protein
MPQNSANDLCDLAPPGAWPLTQNLQYFLGSLLGRGIHRTTQNRREEVHEGKGGENTCSVKGSVKTRVNWN